MRIDALVYSDSEDAGSLERIRKTVAVIRDRGGGVSAPNLNVTRPQHRLIWYRVLITNTEISGLDQRIRLSTIYLAT